MVAVDRGLILPIGEPWMGYPKFYSSKGRVNIL